MLLSIRSLKSAIMSELKKPDGVPPVSNGLQWCIDGNSRNGMANLVQSSFIYTQDSNLASSDSSDSYGRYRSYRSKSNYAGTSLEFYDNPWEYEPANTYIFVVKPVISSYIRPFVIISDKLLSTNNMVSTTLSLGRDGVVGSIKCRDMDGQDHEQSFDLPINYNTITSQPHVYAIKYNTTRTVDAQDESICTVQVDADVFHNHTMKSYSLSNIKMSNAVLSNGKHYPQARKGYAISQYEDGIGSKQVYAGYIYNRKLSDAEMTKVIDYVSARYNLVK